MDWAKAFVICFVTVIVGITISTFKPYHYEDDTRVPNEPEITMGRRELKDEYRPTYSNWVVTTKKPDTCGFWDDDCHWYRANDITSCDEFTDERTKKNCKIALENYRNCDQFCQLIYIPIEN